jgi:hypothetical protein
MGMTTNPLDPINADDYVNWGAVVEPGDGEPCALCGRRISKEGAETGWWVEMGGGSDLFFHRDAQPDINDPGYMGFFPLGPECAKKIPATHRQKIP